MKVIALDQLGFAAFQRLLNEHFTVEVAPGKTTRLQLIEAEYIGTSSKAACSYENFSLIFTGPAKERLAQRIYRFAHEKLGVFDLFLVPIAAEGDVIRYEVIFNRVPPQNAAEQK